MIGKLDRLKKQLNQLEEGEAYLDGNETELDLAMAIAWQLVEMVEGD